MKSNTVIFVILLILAVVLIASSASLFISKFKKNDLEVSSNDKKEKEEEIICMKSDQTIWNRDRIVIIKDELWVCGFTFGGDGSSSFYACKKMIPCEEKK